jgi:hypothetical protein
MYVEMMYVTEGMHNISRLKALEAQVLKNANDSGEKNMLRK